MHCAIDAFAAFLVQFLGGPSEDSQRRQYLSLRDSHRRFAIHARHRDAWLLLMSKALRDVGIEEPTRGSLQSLFEQASAHLIDRQPETPRMGDELTARWHGQQTLEEAVAAVRAGNAARAIELTASFDTPVLTGLLALMIESGNGELLQYVHARLAEEPQLSAQLYNGRMLLHAAAAAGSLSTVELLLRLGADPNAFDGGKHGPLYSVSNQCGGANAAGIVRTLVRAGARVDARDGVTRSTALHMAARRGNVAVAEALLGCGADIDARDYRGATPLRRAINCRKPRAADFLLG